MNADPFISTIPCDVMFMFTSPIYTTKSSYKLINIIEIIFITWRHYNAMQ